ncbi:MAG: metal ABC transporter permease, partial [Aeromicrobium sp.]
SFRATHLTAMVVGLVAAIGGVVTSYEINAQPGPTIVVLALAVFAVAALAGAVVRRRHSATT